MCAYVYMCGYMGSTLGRGMGGWVCRSELVFFFNYVGLRDKTQVLRLEGRCLFQLSHLALTLGPQEVLTGK